MYQALYIPCHDAISSVMYLDQSCPVGASWSGNPQPGLTLKSLCSTASIQVLKTIKSVKNTKHI